MREARYFAGGWATAHRPPRCLLQRSYSMLDILHDPEWYVILNFGWSYKSGLCPAPQGNDAEQNTLNLARSICTTSARRSLGPCQDRLSTPLPELRAPMATGFDSVVPSLCRDRCSLGMPTRARDPLIHTSSAKRKHNTHIQDHVEFVLSSFAYGPSPNTEAGNSSVSVVSRIRQRRSQ